MMNMDYLGSNSYLHFLKSCKSELAGLGTVGGPGLILVLGEGGAHHSDRDGWEQSIHQESYGPDGGQKHRRDFLWASSQPGLQGLGAPLSICRAPCARLGDSKDPIAW